VKGTVRCRSGGRWQFLFTVRDGRGRRKQISKGGFATEGAARRALAVAISDFERGVRSGPRRNVPTLAEFVREEWLGSLDLRPTTLESYRWLAESYLLPSLGSVRLCDVSGADLAGLYDQLASKGGRRRSGLSRSTVRKVAAVVSGVFDHAVELGLVAASPVDRVPRRNRPRAVRMESRHAVWTEAECRTFVDACATLELGVVWHLMLGTGMRRGEVAALRWSDVHLDAADPYVVVTRNRTLSAGVVHEGPPKSGRGRRVTLDQRLVWALRLHRKQQLEDRIAAGGGYEDGDYVVASRTGTPFRPDSLTARFQRDLAGLDVPRIRLHDLRHTNATLLLANSTPVKVVQERLGHSSITVTLDQYGHVSAELERQAAAVMTALFDPLSESA
jgi:integrase